MTAQNWQIMDRTSALVASRGLGEYFEWEIVRLRVEVEEEEVRHAPDRMRAHRWNCEVEHLNVYVEIT